MNAGRIGRRGGLFAVPAIVLAMVVSSCGDDSGSGMPGLGGGGFTSQRMPTGAERGSSSTYPPVTPGPAATGAHNSADVAFATAMIPHHGQAVVMSDLVIARGSSADVKALARRMKQTQLAEIATMAGWLQGWGAPVPDPYAVGRHLPGMGHGMMDAAQLGRLKGTAGVAADKVFLTLMPMHHQGAIEMARIEQAQGANPEARKLARSIIGTQAAEIAKMRQLRAQLG